MPRTGSRDGGDWAAAEEMADALLESFSVTIKPWFRLKLRHVYVAGRAAASLLGLYAARCL